MTRKKDRELDEEIRSHLDMAVRDRIERGEGREHAEAAARREFGNLALVKEVTREMWGWTWLERLAQDLRYGGRLLRRNPGFTAVAVLSLALGIGANTAIFQVINAVRLRTLPIHDPDTLATIRIADMTGARGNFSSLVREQLMATLSGFFGLIAAALAVVGVYGVVAYGVTRRTQEIGVRIALGADRIDVLRMILREAVLLVGVGMAIGLALAVLGGRAAAALLFGLEPSDPATLALAVGILTVIALGASYIPARAASRIAPMVALRLE
jgi:ABC-type antimicrobial peptide transport system permease subunit